MTKSQKDELPPAKTPNQEELVVISSAARGFIQDCIEDIGPIDTLTKKVQFGILARMTKTYRQIFQTVDENDYEIPFILKRVLYELALSFVYMIRKDDIEPDIYEKFRHSALVRAHIRLRESESSYYRERQSSKDSVKMLKALLESEGYDHAQPLPNTPKSLAP